MKKLLISLAVFVFSGFMLPSQVGPLAKSQSTEAIDRMNQSRQEQFMITVLVDYDEISNNPDIDVEKIIQKLHCNQRGIIIYHLLNKRNTTPGLLTSLDRALLKEYDDELDSND